MPDRLPRHRRRRGARRSNGPANYATSARSRWCSAPDGIRSRSRERRRNCGVPPRNGTLANEQGFRSIWPVRATARVVEIAYGHASGHTMLEDSTAIWTLSGGFGRATSAVDAGGCEGAAGDRKAAWRRSIAGWRWPPVAAGFGGARSCIWARDCAGTSRGGGTRFPDTLQCAAPVGADPGTARGDRLQRVVVVPGPAGRSAHRCWRPCSAGSPRARIAPTSAPRGRCWNGLTRVARTFSRPARG